MSEKPKGRRPTAATLYRNLTEFLEGQEPVVTPDSPIAALLDALKDAIVEEATRR